MKCNVFLNVLDNFFNYDEYDTYRTALPGKSVTGAVKEYLKQNNIYFDNEPRGYYEWNDFMGENVFYNDSEQFKFFKFVEEHIGSRLLADAHLDENSEYETYDDVVMDWVKDHIKFY